MENQGDIDRQQLAGAISTATHGTGIGFPNLPAQVVALRLVTADGEVHEVSEEADPELFRAARVSLGALGVITRVTLRCVPLFTLAAARPAARPRRDARRARRPCRLERPLRVLRLPVHGPRDDARERAERPRDRADASRGSGGSTTWSPRTRSRRRSSGSGAPRPAVIPALNRRIVPLMQPSKVVDHAYRVYASRRNIPFTEMEYGIPRAAAAEAIRRLVDLIERRRLPGIDAVRGPVHEGRRRLPEHRRRPRHVLHRGPPVPRDGLRRLLPRRRADHGRLRRPPALGQAPLPDRGDARAALPGLGRVPGRAPPARPRRRLHQRLHGPRARRRYRKQRPSPRYVGTWSTIRPPDTR